MTLYEFVEIAGIMDTGVLSQTIKKMKLYFGGRKMRNRKAEIITPKRQSDIQYSGNLMAQNRHMFCISLRYGGTGTSRTGGRWTPFVPLTDITIEEIDVKYLKALITNLDEKKKSIEKSQAYYTELVEKAGKEKTINLRKMKISTTIEKLGIEPTQETIAIIEELL